MIPDLSISDFKLAKSVCLANWNVSTPVASYAPPPIYLFTHLYFVFFINLTIERIIIDWLSI